MRKRRRCHQRTIRWPRGVRIRVPAGNTKAMPPPRAICPIIPIRRVTVPPGIFMGARSRHTAKNVIGLHSPRCGAVAPNVACYQRSPRLRRARSTGRTVLGLGAALCAPLPLRQSVWEKWMEAPRLPVRHGRARTKGRYFSGMPAWYKGRGT